MTFSDSARIKLLTVSKLALFDSVSICGIQKVTGLLRSPGGRGNTSADQLIEVFMEEL